MNAEAKKLETGTKMLYKDKVVQVLAHKGSNVRIQDNGREFAVNEAALTPIPESANVTSKNKIGVGTVIPKEVRKQYTVHKTKTAGGSYAIDNSDNVADRLRGKPLEEVYLEAVAEINKHSAPDKQTSVAELKKRYEGKNLGMQRMNLGNLIRGASKKAATKKAKDEAKARAAEAKAKADAAKPAKTEAAPKAKPPVKSKGDAKQQAAA